MKMTERMALSHIEKARKLLDEAEREIRAYDGELWSGRGDGFLLEASEAATHAAIVYRKIYRNRR